MKKEYHLTLTRKDRIYISGLIVFLIAWETVKPLLFKNGTRQLPASVTMLADTSFLANHPALPAGDEQTGDPVEQDEPDLTSEIKTVLAVDDLVATDERDLVAIGFSKKTAHNLKRYLAAGGHIRDTNDLRKIYGMDENQYTVVMPYLIFPAKPSNQFIRDTTSFSRWEKPNPTTIKIDINTATPEEWESLPGIGPVLAERILKFRKALGGFARPDQIKECYGLTEDVYTKISSRLSLISPYDKFTIAEMTADSFAHPYLDRKMVKLLRAYAKQHGAMQLEDLGKIYPPDTNWYQRLIPYLQTEKAEESAAVKMNR